MIWPTGWPTTPGDGYGEDDEHYADVESFQEHYGDEIDGRAIYPDQIEPEPVATQLALWGGL